jgi:hypothetical protein
MRGFPAAVAALPSCYGGDSIGSHAVAEWKRKRRGAMGLRDAEARRATLDPKKQIPRFVSE